MHVYEVVYFVTIMFVDHITTPMNTFPCSVCIA